MKKALTFLTLSAALAAAGNAQAQGVTVTIACGTVGIELKMCQDGGARWAKATGNTVKVFQSPNLKAIMSSAPPERSGGASGTVATSRLLGQSVGAALVALCFGIAGPGGPALALALAAGFAGAASVVSFARLLAGE